MATKNREKKSRVHLLWPNERAMKKNPSKFHRNIVLPRPVANNHDKKVTFNYQKHDYSFLGALSHQEKKIMRFWSFNLLFLYVKPTYIIPCALFRSHSVSRFCLHLNNFLGRGHTNQFRGSAAIQHNKIWHKHNFLRLEIKKKKKKKLKKSTSWNKNVIPCIIINSWPTQRLFYCHRSTIKHECYY